MIGLIVFLPMAGALISYIAGRRGGDRPAPDRLPED